MISLHAQPLPAQLWLAARPPHSSDGPRDPQDDSDLDARSLRILIVEDEFFIALDVQSLVQGLGHTAVGIAVSADQAVRLAQREQPDVALVDIRMIGARDGIDAAAEIFNRFGVVLRHTSRAFEEDPLRVLHGMQFAARFSLRTAPGTLEVCRRIAPAYQELATERAYGLNGTK